MQANYIQNPSKSKLFLESKRGSQSLPRFIIFRDYFISHERNRDPVLKKPGFHGNHVTDIGVLITAQVVTRFFVMYIILGWGLWEDQTWWLICQTSILYSWQQRQVNYQTIKELTPYKSTDHVLLFISMYIYVYICVSIYTYIYTHRYASSNFLHLKNWADLRRSLSQLYPFHRFKQLLQKSATVSKMTVKSFLVFAARGRNHHFQWRRGSFKLQKMRFFVQVSRAFALMQWNTCVQHIWRRCAWRWFCFLFFVFEAV